MLRTTTLLLVTLAACQSEPATAPHANPDASVADEVGTSSMSAAFLANAQGHYAGTNRLWFMDPEKPFESDAEATVGPNELRYTWSFEGEPQSGVMAFSISKDRVDVDWTDTWHSPRTMRFTGDHVAGAIVVHGNWDPGDGTTWGWRIELETPSPGQLEIEMVNIEPSGEESLAVRLEGASAP